MLEIQFRSSFKPNFEKMKISTPKNCLYFNKWNFLAARLKNPYILYISENEVSSPKIKTALIFSQSEVSLYFRKRNFFKKTYYISGGKFPSSQNKKTLSEKISCISNLKHKKLFVFQEGTLKSQAKKNISF